ncbi:pyruvate kinase [Egicoccus halophilus]|uniref:Pyruvate kinase n=1 Tax=Egicoccus halophilus TaxID=1670830 RepID=A0A8J3AAB9_9ACTN|nr:pyruvate kinase [Egicoccus halophilus]GGI08909.1 pyruvate kinase [Egicoccus halophilus]
MRRAKIVATLGPALDDPDRLRAAIAAGVDVVRLNFSHGTKEDHQRRLDRIHAIAAEVGRNVGSLGDLQGPKIRLGMVPDEGILLEDGGEVILVSGVETVDSHDEGGVPVLPVVYEHLAEDVDPGALILMDDGLLRLVVSRVEGNRVHARVVAGGPAKSRKGVNLPGVAVSAKSLTDKDREDVATMVEIGVDWIALSFVRRPEDVREVRDLVRAHGGDQPIVAKLERPEAVDDLEAIIKETDAVMVARGDLGVEVGPEKVPAIQKEMIDLANRHSKPVITATEMLDSMIRSPRPTRAEASDVANAIFDGTDAVMLSGETAAGRYPVEAVRTMARIIEYAEAASERLHPIPPVTGQVLARVVAKAAKQVADDVDATAILVFSFSGASVQLVSKFRPEQPVIGLTTEEATVRRLALMWGTNGAVVPMKDHSRDLILAAEEICLEKGYGVRGDTVVIVSGIPGGHGGTNRVMVHRLGQAAD